MCVPDEWSSILLRQEDRTRLTGELALLETMAGLRETLGRPSSFQSL